RAPARSAAPAPRAPRAVPVPAPTPAPAIIGGRWRIQLGAFGLAANADALWARLKARPELAGHARVLVPAGRVTRLMAEGFDQAQAQAACRKLRAAALGCLPVPG
ncbi:MAG: SPOR domain-containing protein, partial [Sphingomonadales bacterium]|nr:SPOR domain-containing protein [Sphingomonadales bacterium]